MLKLEQSEILELVKLNNQWFSSFVEVLPDKKA